VKDLFDIGPAPVHRDPSPQFTPGRKLGGSE
jgi:hypothetical protein